MCNDLGFLAHLPELCDITFMVGREKEPVCAVRAVLGNPSSYNPTTLLKVKLVYFSCEKSQVFREVIFGRQEVNCSKVFLSKQILRNKQISPLCCNFVKVSFVLDLNQRCLGRGSGIE